MDDGLDDNNNPVPTGQWTGTAATSAAVDLNIEGVPEIPFDGYEHGSSATATHELLGNEYIQMYHAVVDGTDLVLTAPADAGVGEYPISYGLYKFAGLTNVEPQWLNIECMPAVFGDEYFVGLADYTAGDWRWFGPVTFPEFQLDMSDLLHHVVTELGNMYVIVLCRDGNSATLSRLVLTVEDGGGEEPGRLPGAPHHLVATDGVYDAKVVIEWESGIGADYYELWRRHGEGEWGKLADVEGNRYEDTEVIVGDPYHYKAFAVNDYGTSAYSNIDLGYAGELGSGGELPAPHEIWASDGAHPDHVVVEWGYEGDYSYFELWRRNAEEGEFAYLASIDGEHFRYEDYEVVPGTVYKYKVRAIYGDLEGPFSDYDTGYASAEGGELPAPHEIWASDGAHPDHVVVEWGYEGDYNYFELWRRPAESGEFAWLASIDGEHFRYEDYAVEPGTVYKYKVRAIHGELEGPFSDYDTGYASAEGGELPAPTGIWASDGAHPDHVVVEWSYEGDYTYFELWRRPEAEGEFAFLDSLDGENFRYEDWDVVPGVVYKYKVRAIFGEMEGPFSDYDTGYAEGGGGIPAPFELWASDGAHPDHVVLEWGYEGDYTYFDIWRRVAEGGEWGHYANVDGEALRYEDWGVDPGVIYEYKVRAILGEHESDWSNHDFGHALREVPGVHPPFELVASKGLYLEKIRVEWSHEGDYDHFELWRKQDGEAHEWAMIAELEAMAYDDTELPGDYTFIYKARAVLGEEMSEFSNTDYGYLADSPETCLIDVVLRHGEEGRWAGVPVVLYGLEEPVVHETNESGLASFEGIARGLYLVVPMHREIAFDPVWQLVDLREGTAGREVFFNGVVDEMQAFRLRGVVFDFAGARELNRFLPLGGVTVHIAQVGTENTWTVETDEAGYWTLPEMVIGTYHVWAEYEGYTITPEVRETAVDGMNLPNRADFRGYPLE